MIKLKKCIFKKDDHIYHYSYDDPRPLIDDAIDKSDCDDNNLTLMDVFTVVRWLATEYHK